MIRSLLILSLFLIACNKEKINITEPVEDVSITWIATQGFSDRDIKMVSHPNGFVLAVPTLTSEVGLYKLNSGDSIWTFTGYKNIEAPLFVTSNGTILSYDKRSTDEGKTWSNIETGGASCFVETTGKIFIGGYGGDWSSMNYAISTNDGLSWSKRNIGDWYPYAPITNIFRNSKKEIFIITSMDNTLYKVNNDFSLDLIKRSMLSYSSVIDAQGFLYTGYSAVNRSTDDGYTWEKVTDDLGYQGYLSLAINSKGHIFVGNIDIGVLRSTDQGITWEQVNQGLTNKNVIQLCVDCNDYLYASMAGSDVVYRTKFSTIRK